MEPRKLAIIVCCSDRWIQVPVGTLGLSSLLSRHDIHHQILHTSLQSPEEAAAQMEAWIREGYSFALVLQWKENTKTFYRVSEFLKERLPDPSRLICGGITASFFCREVLLNPKLPDVLLRGDVEQPLLDYCHHKPVPELENAAYLEAGEPVIKPVTYRIDEALFSSLSFTDFSRLLHAERLFDLVNRRYLHINLTRGCPAQCEYCGGSQFANQQHSERSVTIKRSPESAAADIRRLLEQTRHRPDPINIHLDDFWENYAPVLAAFEDPELRKRIQLNICDRGALDTERLQAHLDLFRHFAKVTFELSPESEDEAQRLAMMEGTGKQRYTREEIVRIARLLSSLGFNLLVFYTVYNFRDTQDSVFKRCEFYEHLKEEIESPQVAIICAGLSLDCGSADYCSLPDPPKLEDYGSPKGRFTDLLGNFTFVRQPADLDYLIAAKFFLVMTQMKDQPARRQFIARAHYTLPDILAVVKKHKLATLIDHEFVVSGKYIPFISEKLLERKFK